MKLLSDLSSNPKVKTSRKIKIDYSKKLISKNQLYAEMYEIIKQYNIKYSVGADIFNILIEECVKHLMKNKSLHMLRFAKFNVTKRKDSVTTHVQTREKISVKGGYVLYIKMTREHKRSIIKKFEEENEKEIHQTKKQAE